ncbi:MAG: hypothetical protein DI534_01365 [Leifsonia xyli]|nr:MAG: hypothetical protein DI534_01365 [Leifsonia xyli]
MRRNSALVSSAAIVVALSATLAACSATPGDVSACAPGLASGSASSLVTATGKVGSEPKVEIPAPLVSKTAERSVLEKGAGLVAEQGMTVDTDLAVYDGATGTKLGTTAYDAASPLRMRAGIRTSEEQKSPGILAKALLCAQPGQRLAVTGDWKDVELNLSQFGLAEGQTIVVVVDVRNVFLGKADGVNQLPQDGMPVVVTAPDGTVGVTVPSGIKPPTADRTSTIKLGSGPKLALGDGAVLQVAVWSWPSDGELSQTSSTWKLGTMPTTLTLTDQGDQAIPAAFLDSLVGIPVGSQVLAVLPPAAGATTKDATIYVIDVLGITSSAATGK